MGSAMLCGQCQQVVNVPTTYDSANVLIGDDFIVRRRLGEGGMGAVHLAHQISLDREVALKVLHPQFTRDRDFVVNFVREARTAAKLNHPNIVQAYAVGEERAVNGSIYYIAMELIEGESVQDILRREGKVSVERSLEIVRDVAAALDHAWQAGSLIHRDIKPDNIMIRAHDNAVKLADLGLAIAAAEVDNEDDEINATPQYLCPENLLGESMDIRGDIYSLGATLFHMLTGEYPFDGDNGIEIARKHISEPLRRPDSVDASIPAPVSDFVSRMMEKDPQDRYSGPKELLKAIDEVKDAMRRPSTGRTKRKFRSASRTSTSLAPVAAATPKTKSASISRSRPAVTSGAEAGHTRAMTPPAATSAMPAGVVAPPAKSNKPLIIALVGVVVVIAFVLIAVLSGGGDSDGAAPPPARPAANTPPKTVENGTETPNEPAAPPAAPVAKDAKLKEMIAEAKIFAAKNPKNFQAQYDLWLKIRAEAQSIGARDKALEAHNEVTRLRKLK